MGFGGDGEIRTREGLLPNAFRVRPVMTTSIRLRLYFNINRCYFTTKKWILQPLDGQSLQLVGFVFQFCEYLVLSVCLLLVFGQE